ncbi:hypothetical protein OGAPHI_005105 [Ogataea philodendri]|uniref:Zn(2)-C6 fungal-type domain-containing protein n=1 Tax=Ogataea philodendri TaxID=1378263 RepID=A0A9P8P2W3_9ASCO|nr:uncharacterized protein OGAPHI_005105 [Ogataea philodendri]KAH3663704.1 hypothetical protein OGAPHI_005105 [Ogataea philodendri]
MKKRILESKKVVPVSCLECRRRKIKCDRGIVCKSCERKKLKCEYPETFRSIKISPPKPKIVAIPDHDTGLSEVDRLRKSNLALSSRVKQLERKIAATPYSPIANYVTAPYIENGHMTMIANTSVELPKLFEDPALNNQLISHLIDCYFEINEVRFFDINKNAIIDGIETLDTTYEGLELVMLVCSMMLFVLDYTFDSKRQDIIDFDTTVERPQMVSTLLDKFREYRALCKYSRGEVKMKAMCLVLQNRFVERDESFSITAEVFSSYSGCDHVAAIFVKFEHLYLLRSLILDEPPVLSPAWVNVKETSKFDPKDHVENLNINPATDLMDLIVRVIDSKLKLRRDNFLIMELLFRIQKKEAEIQNLRHARKTNLEHYEEINTVLSSQMKVLFLLYYCALKIRSFLPPSDYQLESMVKILNHMIELSVWFESEPSADCVPVRNYVMLIMCDLLQMFNGILYHKHVNPKTVELIMNKFEKVASYQTFDAELLEIVSDKVQKLLAYRQTSKHSNFVYRDEVVIIERFAKSKYQGSRARSAQTGKASGKPINFVLDFYENDTVGYEKFIPDTVDEVLGAVDDQDTMDDQDEREDRDDPVDQMGSPTSLADASNFVEPMTKDFATIMGADYNYPDLWLSSSGDLATKSFEVTDIGALSSTSNKSTSFYATDQDAANFGDSMIKSSMELNGYGYNQFMDVDGFPEELEACCLPSAPLETAVETSSDTVGAGNGKDPLKLDLYSGAPSCFIGDDSSCLIVGLVVVDVPDVEADGSVVCILGFGKLEAAGTKLRASCGSGCNGGAAASFCS